jgi:Cu-Zn family superoxide dismutase
MKNIIKGARAEILGNALASNLKGIVEFFPWNDGTLVRVSVTNLPANPDGFFAFHIHEGSTCETPGSHLNLTNEPHPRHTGDLPPLLSNNGFSYMIVFTNRFTIEDILNKTVIIHNKKDDFTTQPAGDPGEIIACGIIKKI